MPSPLNFKGLSSYLALPNKLAGTMNHSLHPSLGAKPDTELPGAATNREREQDYQLSLRLRGRLETPLEERFVAATPGNTGETSKAGRRFIRTYGEKEEMNAKGEYVYQGMQVPDSKESSLQNGSGGKNPYFPQRRQKQEKSEKEKNASETENLEGARLAAAQRNFGKFQQKLKKTVPLETWKKFSEIAACNLFPLSCKLFGF